MRSAALIALTAYLAAPPIAARQAPDSIRGRVVAAEDDRPLRRALVALSAGVDRRPRPVLTDDEGRFEIRLPDRTASLTVAKAGYAFTRLPVAAAFAPRASAGRASDQEFLVRMRRGGVISGRVVDSNGEAAFGMRVVARSVDAAGGMSTFDVEADDLGEYRIAGLPAGRYSVSPVATGPRVMTIAENERLLALVKEGRRLLDVFQESGIPPRTADVRGGDETGNIDFEVAPRLTIRPAVAVKHLVAQLPVPQPGQQGMVSGPPQPELGGARVFMSYDGSPMRGLDIEVSGGSVVSGTIVDAAGEPFQDVVVRALRVGQENGRMVARAFGWPRVTDDRGRYRLFGLSPGSYLLVASLDAAEFSDRPGAVAGYAPWYFPGTPVVDAAQPLRAEAGSEINGADLTFVATPVAGLTGKAVTAAGEPRNGRVLLSVSHRSGATVPEPRVVQTAPDGSFEFADVAPGDYVVQAMIGASFGSSSEFGSEFVTVADRDPPPVTITTSPGATLEGRFVVNDLSDPPMRAYSLHAAPIDLDRSPPNGRGPEGLAVHDDGRFYLTGLFGPMRLLVPNTLPGWYVKSVTIGGADVTDTTVDFGRTETVFADAQIVLSNSAATIAGSIGERPGSSATVIAFSTNHGYWFDGSRHIKYAASGPNGSFEVGGLPPGDYFVAAVDAAASLDVQLPDTLESLIARAARVTAREGAVTTVELRIIRR